jgi:hypothetical protein
MAPVLPAALYHARDFAAQRQFPETQAAQRELPQIGARPATLAAAVAVPNGVLRRLIEVFDFLCSGCHRVLS